LVGAADPTGASVEVGVCFGEAKGGPYGDYRFEGDAIGYDCELFGDEVVVVALMSFVAMAGIVYSAIWQ
jgi:hypothetical protein